MAHEITKRDSQWGIKMAWHNLTKVVVKLTKEIVFPYVITLMGLNRQDNGKPHGNWAFPVCGDDGETVGNGQPLNGDTYSFRTPQDTWEYMESVLKGTGYIVHSAGTVRNRSQYFISVNLDELNSFKVGNREFAPYLNFSGSMDKTMPVQINLGSICIVCANTLAMNFFGKHNFRMRFNHSKNQAEHMENAKKLIEDTVGVSALFKLSMESLADTKTDSEEAKRIYTGFLTPEGETISTRTENQVKGMVTLFETGLGNRGENMLDVLSGFTESRTRGINPKDKWKQFVSSEFGSYSNQKSNFAAVLLEPARRGEIAARGKELLAN